MVAVSTILLIDTYLAAVTAYLAVLRDVDPAYSVIFAGLLIISIALQVKRIVRIPGWALNTVSVAVVALSLFVIRSDHLVEPVLGTLLILMALKFLAEKKVRDYLQIHMLCIFVLVGAGLMSLSILFTAYLAVLAVLSTIALILLAYLVEDQHIAIRRHNLQRIFSEALLICAIALPASAVFFVILPRTDFPILNFLNQGGYAKAGFTDQIQLGKVSQIQRNNSVIFRAQMAPVQPGDLYWRGIVLNQFSGVAWQHTGTSAGRGVTQPHGPVVHQVIYLEPYGSRYLFALDKPVAVSFRRARRHPSDTYETRHDIDTRIRYQADSVLSPVLPQTSIDRRQDLQLPPHFSPKIHALVKTLLTHKQDHNTIATLMHFLKEGDYRYSLKDLPVSPHPLEAFLFKYKRGNCEYFASALAVMLRMAGIPARLVGGYKGGYYNPAGGYYLVLENNAHVWVEAYQAGRGWERLDPTPYGLADPSRTYRKSLLFRWRMLLDTFNYYWYKFIINYDMHKQLLLVEKVKATFTRPNLQLQLPRVSIRVWGSVCGMLLLIGLGMCWVRKKRTTPGEILLTRFLSKMYKFGYHKRSTEGLEEFAAQITDHDLRRRACRFIGEFERIYYRDRPFSLEERERLSKTIDEI